MKFLVYLALLALVFSSQASFLGRHLQEEEVSPPPEDNNGIIAVNETNTTEPDAGTGTVDNNTDAGAVDNGEGFNTTENGVSANETDNAANNTDNEVPADNATNNTAAPLFDFAQLFNATGVYIMNDTNCTVVEFNVTIDDVITTVNSSLCIPQLVLLVNYATNMIDVTFAYPLNDACGNYSNTTVNFTYPYVNGIFMDPIVTGFTGIFLLNNRSVLTLANDTYNTSAGMCYAHWAPLNASNTSNATNASNDSIIVEEPLGVLPSDTEALPQTEENNSELLNQTEANNLTNASVAPATQQLWAGAWNAVSYNSTNASDVANVTCCVPDVPVLIYEDTNSSSIIYMFRAPDCPACGALANTVSLHVATVNGAAAQPNDYGMISYIYWLNNTVVFVTPQCYVVYEPVATKVCNDTDNATNATVAESEL